MSKPINNLTMVAKQLDRITTIPGPTLAEYTATLQTITQSMASAERAIRSMPVGSRESLFKENGRFKVKLGQRMYIDFGDANVGGYRQSGYDHFDMEWRNDRLRTVVRKDVLAYRERHYRDAIQPDQLISLIADYPRITTALIARLEKLITGVEREIQALANIVNA